MFSKILTENFHNFRQFYHQFHEFERARARGIFSRARAMIFAGAGSLARDNPTMGGGG